MRRDRFAGCRFPLSYQDVRDLLAERGISVDRATVFGGFRSSAGGREARLYRLSLTGAESACR